MKLFLMRFFRLTPLKLMCRMSVILFSSSLVFAIGCNKPDSEHPGYKSFNQVNLVANSENYHPVTIDPKLLNGFGLAWSPSGVAWVNSVGGHVSALYSAEGAIVRQPVNIPSPTDTINGLPCGIVFSGNKKFNLPNGPALFLFTGFDGVLSGWNPALGNNASSLRTPDKASFTGLAIAGDGQKDFIYAANFGASKISVWDTAFSKVEMDFKDPSLPSDYSPYNIQAIGDLLFVVYAKLGADGHGVEGRGNGFVSVFNTQGKFIRRFASGGTLNIPWGITITPGSFLKKQDLVITNEHYTDDVTGETYAESYNEGNDLKDPVMLIGNFGDGRINVYTVDGRFLGQLGVYKTPIEIDGLWALSFAPSSATDVDPNRLYFTAGPAKETDGLFGYLIKK